MNFFARLRRQDWLLYGSLFFLAAGSLIGIASSARELFLIQLMWFIAAFAFIFVLASIDLRALMSYRLVAFGVYILSLALLASALFFAPIIRHSRGWFVLGPLRFQPAEFGKVALIWILAYYLARRHIGIAHLGTLFKSFVYVALPAGLVFLEPDWGSAMVMGGVWIGFLLVSGIRWRHLAFGLLTFLIVGILAWNFALAPYQKERVFGFFNPNYDPLGINYSVSQAKIAIGSGGLWGKGFRQGTQTQLGYLTEPATDFIFATIAEEWGLIGILFISGAFLFLVLRIIRLGLKSEDNFSQFMCLGTAILFLTEFIFNVGSNLGLLPVVGVTFPFLSYGGSSLLTKAMLVGIIQSIAATSSF